MPQRRLLPEWLYTGPSFGQSIFDIFLRFHFALGTFLMVSVQEKGRDSLKFLWTPDVNREVPDVIVLRFTCVMFGVNSSHFLLNVTIDHHMQRYQVIDRSLVCGQISAARSNPLQWHWLQWICKWLRSQNETPLEDLWEILEMLEEKVLDWTPKVSSYLPNQQGSNAILPHSTHNRGPDTESRVNAWVICM